MAFIKEADGVISLREWKTSLKRRLNSTTLSDHADTLAILRTVADFSENLGADSALVLKPLWRDLAQ